MKGWEVVIRLLRNRGDDPEEIANWIHSWLLEDGFIVSIKEIQQGKANHPWRRQSVGKRARVPKVRHIFEDTKPCY